MALITQKPKGTGDVTPSQSNKWQTVEKLAADVAKTFGFKEIRFPTFEHTELFLRSVGETTDVVQKEMYTFMDKGNRSITLRPEGTAGTMRAVIENGLLNEAMPLKVYYLTSCFRYEKPQAGRFREHHQFGCEMVGSDSPMADAEIISLAYSVLERIGIKKLKLHINSIGCPCCRERYNTALKDYFTQYRDIICETCLERLEKNPMRLLDCKSPVCRKNTENAPLILDYLCEDCNTHFESFKKYLDLLDIPYETDPKIVRGLDYYTKTVFEFITEEIGSQGTVCAGGRYNNLIEEIGGKSTPALGFGMGLERLILVAEKQGCRFMENIPCSLYIAAMGENAAMKAAELLKLVRAEGYYAETDLTGRGLKSQMKYADKIGAVFTLVLGDNELETGTAKLKNMRTGEQTDVNLSDGFVKTLSDNVTAEMFSGTELV